MYIPLIKEKHSLVDLARYGTRSRKNIHPDVLIGMHPCPPIYKEGDLLDANAILNLVKNTSSQEKSYKALEDKVSRDKEQLENKIKITADKYDQLEAAVREIDGKYDRDIEEIKQKQSQDIQEMKEYVAQEIDKATAIVVYDQFDENLLVYNVKHE